MFEFHPSPGMFGSKNSNPVHDAQLGASGRTNSMTELSSKQWSGYSDGGFSDCSQSFAELGRGMRADEPPSRRTLDEVAQSWLLEPQGARGVKEKRGDRVYVLGVVSFPRRWLWWLLMALCACFVVAGVLLLVCGFASRKSADPASEPDELAVALSKALKFFDIQKSGDLSGSNYTVPWRGSSALSDGGMIHNNSAPPLDLSGGFYDAGDNLKFAFTAAYAMTLLSWSVVEYKAKFQALGELGHAEELIQWGTDFLLKTFNASNVERIYCQVGSGAGRVPNDHHCWERPESLADLNDTRRTAIAVTSGADLAGEIAAALASAAVVFRDRPDRARRLVFAAEAVYAFAKDAPTRELFVADAAFPAAERALYNSSTWDDEMVWGATWLYFATGNATYLADATTAAVWAERSSSRSAFGLFDWDNKLVGAKLLLSRLRLLHGPGYPYEQVLKKYHNDTNVAMCAYLPQFSTFSRTQGGLIVFNPNATQHLPAAANAAFLATLYADYLKAADVPVFQCGPHWVSPDVLRTFSRSQMDYILGKNPLSMSYVVGHGSQYPRNAHHRAASFPEQPERAFRCTEGWEWRDSPFPNPHLLEGALVGGPDGLDAFSDTRANSDQNEPTVAGNAGLVAALVAMVSGEGLDGRELFAAVLVRGDVSPPSATWSP